MPGRRVSHDALGRMTSRTDGIGGIRTWPHDVRGNRLTQANRVGSHAALIRGRHLERAVSSSVSGKSG